MQIDVDASGAGSLYPLSIEQHLLESATGAVPIQLEADIKVLVETFSYATLADLHFSGTACEASFGLALYAPGALSTTRTPTPPSLMLTAGDWIHLTTSITKDNGATGFHEHTTYGDSVVVDRDGRPSGSGSLTGCGSVDLRFGIVEVSADVAHATLRFDNVIVRKL